ASRYASYFTLEHAWHKTSFRSAGSAKVCWTTDIRRLRFNWLACLSPVRERLPFNTERVAGGPRHSRSRLNYNCVPVQVVKERAVLLCGPFIHKFSDTRGSFEPIIVVDDDTMRDQPRPDPFRASTRGFVHVDIDMAETEIA